MRYVGISIFIIFSMLIGGCSADKAETAARQDKTDTTVSNSSRVKVYYFHGAHRCPTCVAVGKITRDLIAEKYPDNKHVEFIRINIDEPGNEEIIEKLQVTGSGLFICCDEKSEDLTAFAFRNARSNPEKLKNKINELIGKNI